MGYEVFPEQEAPQETVWPEWDKDMSQEEFDFWMEYGQRRAQEDQAAIDAISK